MPVNNDQEFREKVLVILTDVQTKMNSLVGADGTNGRVGSLETQVLDLQQERSRMWGAGAAITVLWAAVLGLADYFKKP
jgi:hypothetical protein